MSMQPTEPSQDTSQPPSGSRISDPATNKLESEILAAHRHLAALLQRKNAIIPLISRLPDEVLARVFQFCCSDDPDDGEGWRDPRDVLPALQVCRRWHNVALSFPGLWTMLHSSWHTLMPMLITRSGKLPLTLCWYESDINSMAWMSHDATLQIDSVNDFTMALQQIERMQHIQISLNTETNRWYMVYERLFRALGSLSAVSLLKTLEINGPRSSEPLYFDIDLDHAPALRKLRLYNLEADSFGFWHLPLLTEISITLVTWRPHLDELLDFFQHAPLLRRVILATSTEDDLDDYSRTEEVRSHRVHLRDLDLFRCDWDEPDSALSFVLPHLEVPAKCRFVHDVDRLWAVGVDRDKLFASLLPHRSSLEFLSPNEVALKSSKENVKFLTDSLPTGNRCTIQVALPQKKYDLDSIEGRNLYTQRKNSVFIDIQRAMFSFAALRTLKCKVALLPTSWLDLMSTSEHLATLEIWLVGLQGFVAALEIDAGAHAALDADLSITRRSLFLPSLTCITLHDHPNRAPQSGTRAPHALEAVWNASLPRLSDLLGRRKTRGFVLEEFVVQRKAKTDLSEKSRKKAEDELDAFRKAVTTVTLIIDTCDELLYLWWDDLPWESDDVLY